MIKRSLTRKLIVVFSAILIAVVFLNILFNGVLLSKVHRERKLDAIENLYFSLNSEYSHNSDSDNIMEIVKNALNNENFRVFIWDAENKIVIDSLPYTNNPDITKHDEKSPVSEPPSAHGEFDRFRGPKEFRFYRTEMFMYFMELKAEDIIKSTDTYTVFSLEAFGGYEQKNICLRSLLPGEYKLLIQLPYAPVDEAIQISNILLLIVGSIMLVIGICIVTVTSKTIAKPIKELSHIAKSMETLDFSKKYSGTRCDEIGSLGESINSLSEKLEITINELYDKNKKLEDDIELKSRIDTMRKEFIANASHELKTPIALISGYAEGLKDNIADSDEAREMYTNVIIEEAERMDNIIRQMLDLMELDGADTIFDGRRISLSMIAEDALNVFDLVLKNRQINIKCSFDEDVVVFGDYMRLHQAVTNYISNAINHVDDKKVIEVKIKKIGDKAVFSVYNSGVGIPEGEKHNIWERFYKVDKAHTREYGGSGLGLSIVRSVIELHNGEYGFTNLDGGVEFYFSLNCKEIINED